jgi:hypothetical protein
MANGFQLRRLRELGFEDVVEMLLAQSTKLAALEGIQPESVAETAEALKRAALMLRTDIKYHLGAEIDAETAYLLATRVCASFSKPRAVLPTATTPCAPKCA